MGNKSMTLLPLLMKCASYAYKIALLRPSMCQPGCGDKERLFECRQTCGQTEHIFVGVRGPALTNFRGLQPFQHDIHTCESGFHSGATQQYLRCRSFRAL